MGTHPLVGKWHPVERKTDAPNAKFVPVNEGELLSIAIKPDGTGEVSRKDLFGQMLTGQLVWEKVMLESGGFYYSIIVPGQEATMVIPGQEIINDFVAYLLTENYGMNRMAIHYHRVG